MMRKMNDVIMKVIFSFTAITVTVFLSYLLFYILSRGYTAFTWPFLTTAPHGIKMEGGVFPMIISSLYLTILTLLFAIPLGVGGGIYLAEYAGNGWLVARIRQSIDLLASVPSIVFGLFGLAFFVRLMGWQMSMISGAATLTLMVLPMLLKISEDALRFIPVSYREASLALGATKEQTIFKMLLPTALPAILTGALLSAGRAFGETAAVLFTAGMTPIAPLSPLNGGRTLSVHLYLMATTGYIDTAFRVAVVLISVILVFNLLSNFLMIRYQRRFVKGA